MRTDHSYRHWHHQHRPGLWPGLILASVGGVLLAREFGWLPPGLHVIQLWPLILLFVGLSSLLRARGFMGALFALSFAAVGGLLLARNLGYLTFPAARLWPSALVLLGIALLIRAARGSTWHWPPPEPPVPGSAGPGADASSSDFGADASSLDFREDSSSADGEAEWGDPRDPHRSVSTERDRLEMQILFSGLEFKIESQAWQGGVLGVTAGGVELDLRYARLAPEGALLDVSVLMGGVDIRVPDTWQVQCDVRPFLGGADDSTRSTQGSPRAPLLRVVGSVTLGGLTIRN